MDALTGLQMHRFDFKSRPGSSTNYLLRVRSLLHIRCSTLGQHWVQALGPDRSDPAVGDGVGPRRCASMGYPEIAYPPIEAGAITAIATMNEKTWRLAVPTAAFDDLLCRPLGGRMRRHMHVENLPAGVMDHEEHVQCSKRDGLDAEEIARPDG